MGFIVIIIDSDHFGSKVTQKDLSILCANMKVAKNHVVIFAINRPNIDPTVKFKADITFYLKVSKSIAVTRVRERGEGFTDEFKRSLKQQQSEKVNNFFKWGKNRQLPLTFVQLNADLDKKSILEQVCSELKISCTAGRVGKCNKSYL